MNISDIPLHLISHHAIYNYINATEYKCYQYCSVNYYYRNYNNIYNCIMYRDYPRDEV